MCQEDVTILLQSIANGEATWDQLMEMVYRELHALAEIRMHGEARHHTLQATALVHEAFLRLTQGRPVDWQNRRHFFGAAAEAMRRILVDEARRRSAEKRGGNAIRLQLSSMCLDGTLDVEDASERLVDVHEALEALQDVDPDKAELVKLRYFAGLSEEEAAQTLGISRATAARWWAFAKAWLFDRLNA
ncbi:MAG: sigma-70 family RNA polymerase sigma factor [Planctomycetales bacterium]|nr:sigma-70 family RNA polymerase sigma factor [Planctomycetales bacterium]